MIEGPTLLERVRGGDALAIEQLVALARPRPHGGATHTVIPWSELRQEGICEILSEARETQSRRDEEFAGLAVARARRRMEALLAAERRRAARFSPLQNDRGEILHDRPADSPPAPGALHDALARLSPRQRSLLVRLYWEGRTTQDISQQDGLSVDTVRRVHRRAQAALRDLLRDRYHRRRAGALHLDASARPSQGPAPPRDSD